MNVPGGGSTVQCSAVQCSLAQFSAVQCSAMHYSAAQCSECSAPSAVGPWLTRSLSVAGRLEPAGDLAASAGLN
jgi:hypothetical protein